MTLDDLLIDCCTRLNYPPVLAEVDAKVKARLTAFLNQTQDEILGQPTYRRLLNLHYPLTTTANQYAYGLPHFVKRVRGVIDNNNQHRFNPMSADAFFSYVPNPFATLGTPMAYAFDGWGPVQNQPNEPSQAFAFAPNDGLNVKSLTMQAVQSIPLPESMLAAPVTITLDNTVLIPGKLVMTNVQAITSVKMSAPATGPVDLYAVGITTATQQFLGRIMPQQTMMRSPIIYLTPTPTAAQLLTVLYERDNEPLVASLDEPLLPRRFHYILAAGARMKEYELRGDGARHQVAQREYTTALGFLNAWISDQPDAGDYTVPDEHRRDGPSVLGPWFPYSSYR